jgi:uncharacterized protein (TIGR02058 family)
MGIEGRLGFERPPGLCVQVSDLYGGDYSKVACCAVHDALHHSSAVLFRSVGYDHGDMRGEVTIGVQKPDKIDIAVVTSQLPGGRTEVTVVHGGLNVNAPENGTTHVVATAAIGAFLPIECGAWRLSASD